MRIALVLYTFSDTHGGVERYAFNLARGLASRGHEVHVICHQILLARPLDGVAVHTVPATEWCSALRYASFARHAAAFLQREPFDVIHGFGRTYRQDILRVGGGSHWEYLLHTKPMMNTALGRFLRRWNPRDRVILSLERRAFAPGACRKVVCVSRRVRDEIQRYFGVPNDTLCVLPNGVDGARFSPAVRAELRRPERERMGLAEGEMAVLFVGTGFERKGLRYAVEAAALVAKDARMRLLVAGRGAMGPYQRLARRTGLSGLQFLGETSDVETLYAAADALVLPSLYDPFPNACLEAMACGVPVITTAVTGVAELITHGVDSYVVESGDCVLDLAACLRELRDPARRDAVGRAARAAAERYTVEWNLDRNLNLYEEVAAAKKANSNPSNVGTAEERR